ncbi:GTPase activating protein (GAP) for Rho1p [Savitreella phatthalungensis]
MASRDLRTDSPLVSWWARFKSGNRAKKDIPQARGNPTSGIFSRPLEESIAYANVAISLYNQEGKPFIYGYIPIVVAKCGLYLKEEATDTEGIFRVSGSAKRLKELQDIFDAPPKYGKGLDWRASGFTVHDAASILRRYLVQLPEPIIPTEWYDDFREPLKREWPPERAIERMQHLVASLPPLNRQLLLYILDLLAVFASKSDVNRMTSENLSAIFQPGLLTHPRDVMAPSEYRLSQEVLVFLIDNQSHFLLDMCPPTDDPVAPSPPMSRTGAGIARRRTLVPRRVTPQPTNQHAADVTVSRSSSALSRSNTVPSKRSAQSPPLGLGITTPRHVSSPIVMNQPQSGVGATGALAAAVVVPTAGTGAGVGGSNAGSGVGPGVAAVSGVDALGIHVPTAIPEGKVLKSVSSSSGPGHQQPVSLSRSPMHSRTSLHSQDPGQSSMPSRSVTPRSRRASQTSSEFAVVGGRKIPSSEAPTGATTSTSTGNSPSKLSSIFRRSKPPSDHKDRDREREDIARKERERDRDRS